MATWRQPVDYERGRLRVWSRALPDARPVPRPPLPARVRLQDDKPVQIYFQGQSGTVVHSSGPWRTSGEWWEEQPWQHDDWDLEIVFTGEPPANRGSSFYRCFYDLLQEKWFVRGVYD